MTTATQTNIHFAPPDLSHTHSSDYSALHFGRMSAASATVYFAAPEDVDAVMAELAALKAEMLAPAPDDPDVAVVCHDFCDAPGAVYYCSLEAGHPGLHAMLTGTGAFIAEWGYPDGHVHTAADRAPMLTPKGEAAAAEPFGARPYACCEHCGCDDVGDGHLIACQHPGCAARWPASAVAGMKASVTQ